LKQRVGVDAAGVAEGANAIALREDELAVLHNRHRDAGHPQGLQAASHVGVEVFLAELLSDCRRRAQRQHRGDQPDSHGRPLRGIYSSDSRSTRFRPGSSANSLYRLRKLRYAVFPTLRTARSIRIPRPPPSGRSRPASRLRTAYPAVGTSSGLSRVCRVTNSPSTASRTRSAQRSPLPCSSAPNATRAGGISGSGSPVARFVPRTASARARSVRGRATSTRSEERRVGAGAGGGG